MHVKKGVTAVRGRLLVLGPGRRRAGGGRAGCRPTPKMYRHSTCGSLGSQASELCEDFKSCGPAGAFFGCIRDAHKKLISRWAKKIEVKIAGEKDTARVLTLTILKKKMDIIIDCVNMQHVWLKRSQTAVGAATLVREFDSTLRLHCPGRR